MLEFRGPRSIAGERRGVEVRTGQDWSGQHRTGYERTGQERVLLASHGSNSSHRTAVPTPFVPHDRST